jgi:propionyl-CoA carboxylase alpha chain
MHNSRWRAGRISTGFIAEEFPNGFHPIVPQGEQARLIAAVAAAIDHVIGERKRRISGQMGGRTVTRQRRRAVWLGDNEMALSVAREAGGIAVRFIEDGAEGPARILTSDWKPGELVWTGTVHGTPVAVQVRPILNGFLLAHGGVEVSAFVYTEREAAAARLMPVKPPSDSGKKLLCPMPGLVRSIAVTEGSDVKAGDMLAVVEAMKMENVLRAERDGVVKKIFAKPGDSLAVDAVIMEFA